MVSRYGSDGEFLIDGTYFTFPPTWWVTLFDTWPQFQKPAGELALKGCDVVAIDENTLWLIEVKDYTYPDADQPADLPVVVGQKAAGTMALIFSLGRHTASSGAVEFARACGSTTAIHLALHIEVKDADRKGRQAYAVLAALQQKLRRTQKSLGLHKAYVTSALAPHPNTPWSARRDPNTRANHVRR